MAQVAEIECVNKTNRYNPHERITHVGGRAGNGWKITQEAAINFIETGQWNFYATRGGNTVAVIVAVSRWGNKYLKTTADGEQPDNLSCLPE